MKATLLLLIPLIFYTPSNYVTKNDTIQDKENKTPQNVEIDSVEYELLQCRTEGDNLLMIARNDVIESKKLIELRLH